MANKKRRLDSNIALRIARVKLGYTQKDLASLLNMSVNYYSAFERNNDFSKMRVDSLVKLYEITGLDLYEILKLNKETDNE